MFLRFDLLKMFIMDPSLESVMVESHFVEQQAQLILIFGDS